MIAELILLLHLASPVLCSNFYYVTPNHGTLCPGQPCLTLSQYVQQSNRYFTSNTTFMFLAGDHSLQKDLVLEGITNFTFIGDNSLLPKITSKIKCTGSVNIKFDTVSKITVTSLAFSSCGKETSNDGAVHLTDARDFSFFDCIFRDNAFTALSAIHSSLTLNKAVFTNDSESALRIGSSVVISIHNSFSNNSGHWGGAAAIISSSVNFIGTTVFDNNSGEYGGSLYLDNTTVRFTGTNVFRNGYANITGGALYAISASVISFHGNSTFINNLADIGGAIYADSSTVHFKGNSSFIYNSALYGGGICSHISTMISEGSSSFINNLAGHGRGVHAYSGTSMSFKGGSSFNSRITGGGGIYASTSTIAFVGTSSFINSSADYVGGGMNVYECNMNFKGDSSFVNNSADYGGGIHAYDSTMNFEGDSSFINNLVDYGGGGIHAYGSTMNFEGDSSIINNSAENGGGICTYNSTMSFEEDSTFINNSADYGGGGIATFESTMNFEGDSTFVNNSAGYGGGIYAYNSIMNFDGDTIGGGMHAHSTMNFEGDSSFINNSADLGGGLAGNVSIMNSKRNSKFINNLADIGGGIYADSSTINFEGDSSFINNSADIGGVISIAESIMIFEEDSSFVNNLADYEGGGITAYESTLKFKGDSSFVNNSANYCGGVHAYSSAVNFEGDSSFINNLADYQGGGVCSYNSNMNFKGNNSFINNSADYEGGGITAYESTLNFKGDSSFVNNSADYGGGIHAYSSTMNFDGNSSFINNNLATIGGGIHAHSSTMNFDGDSSFINNSADLGGGLAGNVSIMNSKRNSKFINNLADIGGGIYADSSTINFEGDSSFINNSASIGGVISTAKSIMNFEGDSSFINNSANYQGGGICALRSIMNFKGDSCFISNSAHFGGGGIWAYFSTMNFDGNSSVISSSAYTGGEITDNIGTTIDAKCRFYNNLAHYGGGIMVVNSTLNFFWTCSFSNNSATYGGGIALDTCKLYLFQQLYFTGNHAKRGGAINVFDSILDLSQYCRQADDFTIIANCFLQEPSSGAVINVSLIFENNSASEGGDHLYGGAIDYCDNVQMFDRFHFQDLVEIGGMDLSEEKVSDISSDPIKVCVCDITDHPDCDKYINVTTYPGESFIVTVVAVGQRNGTVAAVIQSSFDKESTAKLKAEENLQSSNKACTTLTYTVFSNTTSERIDLYAEGPCSPGLGKPLSIDVKLQHCPDGFEFSPTTRACICEKRLQTYTNSCDINGLTIFRADHSEFWVGYDDKAGGLILHPHCPFDYCAPAHVSFTLNDTDFQCNYNRSGLLCGKCQTDLSLVLGTSRCLECSNNFLTLLPAFAIAGLLLVFFLLICRLTVAVGSISGLIFYANIVAVNQSIFFPKDPNFSTKFLKVFIAWLNLDLGIETCFYNGMNTYAKTWLQFVFPIYIWFLVGVVIISSRYSQIVARTLGTNPVAVLATLFLFSYTKILRTILTALSFTNLQYPNDITHVVWLYDGNITYFSGRHIPLFITAIIVFFALFLPYTLLLLLGQCLQARSNWRILAWVNSPRLKTIMDAYHGPYRDERRYWPGMLLGIRFILLLVFSSNALHDPSVNLLAIITCTLGLLPLIWLFPGVYKKWYLEALEAFFILNLGILAAATYHVKVTGGSQAAVVSTSVGAAFVVFIGIIIYHMYLQISNIRKERRIRNYRRFRALQMDEEADAARAAAENQVPSQCDLERVITDETRALVPTTEVVVSKRETILAMETELAVKV